MLAPVSWIRAYADLPDVDTDALAAALVRVGLKVESIRSLGSEIEGVVVGEVQEIEELTDTRKPIRYVAVATSDGVHNVICGATNFAVGTRVAFAKPGARLPGGFEIGVKTAYGRESAGMIASARELDISDDHTGILNLENEAPLGADIRDVLGLRDDVLDIEVTPDRGYCLSIRGLAREAAAAFEVAYTDPADVNAPAAGSGGYDVVIDDASGCDRYVARVVRGVDVGAQSPTWLTSRLTACGMRPVSLTVDVTNYVMLLTGQPLHAFDLARLSGSIVVRRARKGERIVTLDDVERALDPDDLLITDDSGAIAIAGVMGGGPTEVSASTTDVLIESAHFDPGSVARAARRHGLPSEAARRFQQDVDGALAPAAAEVAVQLLEKLASATADDAATDVDLRTPRPSIRMRVDRPARVVGFDIDAQTVRTNLQLVGCSVTGDDVLDVEAPSWRPDLSIAEDLVEEVVRLIGFDAIPSELPLAPAGRGLTRHQRLRRAVNRALAAAGYVEVSSPPFIAPSMVDALLLDAADVRRRLVAIANPLSDQESAMRSTLLPGLLGAIARNVSRGTADVALFEVGAVFRARSEAARTPNPGIAQTPDPSTIVAIDAALPEQPIHAAVALVGNREPAGWWGPARAASWADAVQAVRDVAAALGVPLTVRRASTPPWHPGRCAQLLVDDIVIGHAGELHPRVVDTLGLPSRTCAAEFAIAPLLATAPDIVPAPKLSAFPAATLDVALVVDETTPSVEVEAALRDGAGPMLESLRLFDVYVGEQIGAGRKSLAYALVFRAPDRTLTIEEATAARDEAVAEAARRAGASLRGI